MVSIWVVGAGGIGATFGVRLEQHLPGSVTFVDEWAEHVAAINAHGLRGDYATGSVVVHPPATSLADLPAGSPDLVILAVKAYDTARVMEMLAPSLGTAPVVSLQNSLNGVPIAEHVGLGRTVGTTVYFDGAVLGPGHVRQLFTEPKVIVGPWDDAAAESARFAIDVMQNAEPILVEPSSNVIGHLWGKLVVNAMMSGATAALDCSVGELVDDDDFAALAIALARETLAVVDALGVEIPDPTMYGCHLDCYRAAPGTEGWTVAREALRRQFTGQTELLTSMHQDLLKHRPTEIDQINGIVLRDGTAHDLSLPVTARVVSLVRSLQAGAERPARTDLLSELAPAQGPH